MLHKSQDFGVETLPRGALRFGRLAAAERVFLKHLPPKTKPCLIFVSIIYTGEGNDAAPPQPVEGFHIRQDTS